MIFRPAAILLACVLFLFISPSFAVPPAPNQVETGDQFGLSETLFVTMAAINAAGYDDGLNSSVEQKYPIRQQIRQELAKQNIPCLPELRAFYQQHRKTNPGADLGQYISYAVLAAGPPLFELPMGDLPPDVQDLKGLGPLLVRFYKEANVADLWRRSTPAYAAAVGKYQDPVIEAIFEANGYVRNPSGFVGRRFQIFLDLQGAPNQVQVRNYRDNYYVVITPSDTPIIDEIRDAYLAYLLDPLSFRYRVVIDERKPLERFVQDAPALDPAYKHDFSLLVTKSLIKAIDARLTHDPDKRSELVNQAMREGYILTEAFAGLLPVYEKQQESLLSYYPDLISAVDTRKVEHRMKDFEFAKTATPRVAAGPSTEQMSAGEQTFEAAEGLYEQEQYSDAARLYKKVFEQTTDKQLHGRSYYRLGLIAVRGNQKDQAVEMFERAVQNDPDPMTTAWSHVYLGRLAQAAGDTGKASEQFKLALSVDGASPMAKDAAQKGLQSSSSGEKQQ